MEKIKCPYCGQELTIWYKIDWLDDTYSVQCDCSKCGSIFVEVNSKDIITGVN